MNLEEQFVGIQFIGMNINLNKQIKCKTYLDFLINLSFQGVNRLFVLSFENEQYQESHRKILSSNYRN